LEQVRAGARSDDEEKRILHLAVQPDDPRQPAEHLALTALAQHRAGIAGRCACRSGVIGAAAIEECGIAHAATAMS
jgi:hypothetical protein